jgi:ubiquinone/menaquinone biosynthesis C-methylase UbiE
MTEATSDLAVLERLVPIADRDIADVGCGPGRLAVALAARGARVTGLEITEAKVSAARHASDGSAARFAVGRGEALGLADASQDVVVYLRSLHHVPVAAMGSALRQARRVLRDGGVLYVVEPLPEGDFFAMVSLVEDETEARAAAQAALATAPDHGFTSLTTERYETAGVYGDLEDVRRQFVGVDPARAPVFDAHRAELEQRLRSGGTPVADGIREFRQPQRVEVLH